MEKGKYGTHFVSSLDEAVKNNKGALIYANFTFDPITKGGTSNPNTLQSEYSVLALVKFCGFIFGSFINAGPEKIYKINSETHNGDHAEDNFMAAWEEFVSTSVYKEILDLQNYNKEAAYITIKISKSPCIACTSKLIKFIKSHSINIRMKILQLYGGQPGALTNRLSVLALISHGFAIKSWDVLNPNKGHRSYTKRGHPHEMFFASLHLKNVSLDDEADEARVLTNEEQAFIEFRSYVVDSNIKLKQQIEEALSYFENPPAIETLIPSKAQTAKKLLEFMETIRKDTRLSERLLMSKELYHMLKSISFSENLKENAFGKKIA